MVKGFGKAYIMEFHFQSRLPVLCLRKVQHIFHSLPSIGCKLIGPNEQTHRLLGIQILQCLALSSFHRTFSSSGVWLFFPSSQPSVTFMFCSFFLPKKPSFPLVFCSILLPQKLRLVLARFLQWSTKSACSSPPLPSSNQAPGWISELDWDWALHLASTPIPRSPPTFPWLGIATLC